MSHSPALNAFITPKVWSSNPSPNRSSGRIVLVTLFFMVATLASVALLFKLAYGLPRPDLCYSSSRMPGRLHGYLCSGVLHNVTIVESRKGRVFGVASSVHVVHLARRKDRFDSMERLRSFLGAQWTYEDALDKKDTLVDALLESVRIQRSKPTQFEWPSMNSTIPPLTDEWIPHASTGATLSASLQKSSDILPCATGDNDIPTYKDISTIPFYKILSRGMIACWYSHLQVLRKVALSLSSTAYDNSWDGREGTAIIFEDDIDVERDIERRLKDMWSDLPKDWDMLFLGHCWSDESVNPSVSPSSPIHLSNAPKCTHAYAVSARGAQRLLLHLTYPPFAFSRALDQAFAHLIRSGRINAYSVVPSIVIQRKERNDSDIWATSEGSTWRETLQHSAFEAMGNNSVLL